MALKVTVLEYGTIDCWTDYLKYHVHKDIQDPHGVRGFPKVSGDLVVIYEVRDEDGYLHEGLVRVRMHGVTGSWGKDEEQHWLRWHLWRQIPYHDRRKSSWWDTAEKLGWGKSPQHYFVDWWKPTDEQIYSIQEEIARILLEHAEDLENPQHYTGATLYIVGSYRRVKGWLGLSEFHPESLRWIRIPLSRNPRLRWARRIPWKTVFWVLVGVYLLGVVIHLVNRARRV